MRFEFTLGPSGRERLRPSGPVRRLLVLADLRGDAAATEGLLDRALVKVDLDNLDAALARLAPVVQLGAAAGGERLEIRTFDDFHPDRLVDSVSVFGRLRGIRTRLGHPSTFTGAVAELQHDVAASTSVTSSPAASTAASTDETTSSALDRLLGRRPEAAAPSASSSTTPRTVDDVANHIIRQAIAPHIVPAPNPQLPQMLAAVDAAMTDLMRDVLHDPAFQSVESIWRAVQWLVSTLELDETLELLLLHVTRDELGRGAGHGGDLWRRLVEREARAGDGLQASALLVGFTFGPDADDVATLQALGALGAALHAPVVAGASPACLGVSSVAAQPDPREWTPLDRDAEARWTTLRVQPAAAHLGLIAPRFLLRLPYGQKSDPVSAFRFEEQPPTPKHEWFLWGNSAFACGVVISRVLAPDVDLDSAGTLERLPAFVYTSDDESTLQAPAEIAPTEAAVIAIQSRGIMPIVSYKGRDDIRLVMLHSLASPPSDLLV